LVLCIVLSEIQFRYDYELFEGIDRTSIIPIIVLASAMVNSYGKSEVTNEDSSKTEDVTYKGQNILSTEIKQEKEDIFLSDMCKKLQLPEKSKSVYKKNQLYMGNFLLISVFYSIAVMQLAFLSAAKQRRLGDNNICFFNSKCQNPLGPFLDFNHFYSNLGYAVFGLLFAGMVFMKNKKFNNLLKEAKEKKCELKKTCARLAELDSTHGIPHQFGIYYTLGGALAMEGLMSASYHVCPTTISFQFDTTFMYLIAILIYIKLFQNRHPDVTSNSLKAYIVLGLALILEALSLYFSHPLFWVVFCILYMCLLIVMVANFYQLGTHRSDIRFMHIRVTKLLVSETVKAVQKLFGSKKIKIRPLLIFLTFTCVINIAMCIYFAINATHNKEGASNYLLMMFMANMFLYLVYYIVMKYVSSEALCLQSRLYLGFAFLTGLPSMYFFMNKEKNSNVSPAESRDMNQYCSLLHFYDGHDIWHFLGGAGLFFTYMFLLTIDEDIKYKKRTHIPVF